MLAEKIDTFSGHRDCVYTLESGADPQFVFSAGGDGLIVQWNLAKPDIGKILARVTNSVYVLRFHAERNELWVGHNYEGIVVLNLESKQVVRSLKMSPHAIYDIAFYQDWAFVAGGDGVITVIDIPSWSFKKHLKVTDTHVRSLSINPVRVELAAGFSDKHIRIFSLHDLSLKHHYEAHQNSVFSVRYSRDYTSLLSAGRDARLNVWNCNEAYTLKQSTVAHLFAINDTFFSPDGMLFATCSMDKSIKIWDSLSGKLLKVLDQARHAGHGTSVNRLLWSSFDNQLLACSDDKTISVWHVNR